MNISLLPASRAVKLLPLAAAILLPGLTAHAEVAVTVDHKDTGTSSVFRFKDVPPPRQNSAMGATFTLVDGEADSQGQPLDVLHDGKLPTEDDQPDSNFFFGQGHDSERLVIDLGKTIPVKEVATYSWHTDVRAPQVYKLYGSDGSGAGFVVGPRAPADPAHSGWKLIAAVDTRTKFQMAGGQYGVSITDPTGLVGSYRYLLFDVAATETDDAFGQTFFSEINVINRDSPTDGKPLAIDPAANKKIAEYDQKGYHLTFKSDDPTFDPKEQDRLVQTFFTVYPEMVETYNKNASKSVVISIETKYHGVAATESNRIHCNPVWFHEHPEDIDVVTHEGMHVVQAYRWEEDPGWLIEGIADYARQQFGVNNPGANWTLPDYRPSQSYKDAYRVTARFLVWIEKHVKPGIVVAMDKAMRDGKYTADTWKQQTGKSVDELWADYGKNPAL